MCYAGRTLLGFLSPVYGSRVAGVDPSNSPTTLDVAIRVRTALDYGPSYDWAFRFPARSARLSSQASMQACVRGAFFVFICIGVLLSQPYCIHYYAVQILSFVLWLLSGLRWCFSCITRRSCGSSFPTSYAFPPPKSSHLIWLPFREAGPTDIPPSLHPLRGSAWEGSVRIRALRQSGHGVERTGYMRVTIFGSGYFGLARRLPG